MGLTGGDIEKSSAREPLCPGKQLTKVGNLEYSQQQTTAGLATTSRSVIQSLNEPRTLSQRLPT